MIVRNCWITLAVLMPVSALADQLPLPKAAYSADVVFEAKGHQAIGRINVDGAKERRAVHDAVGHDSIDIIRRDLGKFYQLRLQRNVAVELRMSAAEASGDMGAAGSDVDAYYGADATPEGKETVAGLPTTKYHIKAESSPGLLIDALVWSTEDGIIVRVVGKTSVDADNKPARMELSNVSRGPQDPTLFEVPQGATVISASAELDDGAGPAKPAAGSSDPAPVDKPK